MTKPQTRGNQANAVRALQPKRRKAFDAAKDNATKQRIEHNATASPLLTLPPEIRSIIFKALLGDRLLHIRRSVVHLLSITQGLSQPQDDRWEHFVCTDPGSVNKYYQDFWNGKITASASNGNDHEDCVRQHDGKLPKEATQLDLKVLRACRQLYNECSFILWTANTFSFDDSQIFGGFMSARVPWQTKTLRRLNSKIDNTHREGPAAWHKVLNMKLVRSLQGLRELNLDCAYTRGRPFVDWFLQGTINTYNVSILRFRVLHLARATVILNDNHMTHWVSRITGGQNRYKLLWTTEDQRKVAKHAESVLLDTEGAEKFLREREEWIAIPRYSRSWEWLEAI